MLSLIFSVNFGTSGLTTVGYALYNPDGAIKQNRTTAEVSELGSSGVYQAVISLEDNWQGTILWDTGEETPAYATEHFNYQQFNMGGAVGFIQTDTWTQKEKEELLKQIAKIIKALKNQGLLNEDNANRLQDNFKNLVEAIEKFKKEIIILQENLHSKLLEGVSSKNKNIQDLLENSAKIKSNLTEVHKWVETLGKAVVALMEAQELGIITKEVEDVLSGIGRQG